MWRARVALRVAALLGLLVLLGTAMLRVVVAVQRHQELQSEVVRLESERLQLVNEYSTTVEQKSKLESDPAAREALLKERMGYSRRNETPIVVTIEE